MKSILVTSIVVGVSCILVGCQSGFAHVNDYRLYNSGEPKSEGWVTALLDEDHVYGQDAEYYQDNRLKQIRWRVNGKPITVLRFHPNGQLKSEERFLGEGLDFAVYYDQHGTVEKTIGRRLGALAKGGP